MASIDRIGPYMWRRVARRRIISGALDERQTDTVSFAMCSFFFQVSLAAEIEHRRYEVQGATGAPSNCAACV